MHRYAEAAIVHARQQHLLEIDFSEHSLGLVDSLLDRCRGATPPSELQSLALCYGSWLGELAVARLSAKWIGMHEPHPPRIEVVGRVYGPIEAVQRRLEDAQAPSLSDRWNDLRQVSREHRSRCQGYAETNRLAWNDLAADPRFSCELTEALPSGNIEAARQALDPWLAELPLPESRLLCLAAGGGTHAALHALAGYEVTVVDVSERMLDLDRRMARQLNLPLMAVAGTMEDLSMFGTASFDCVLQPVSTCYVPDVSVVYRQVARVLKPGGLYVLQSKQPMSLQVTCQSGGDILQVSQPAFTGQMVQRGASPADPLEPGTVEFVHSLDAMLGGLCRSGFVIEDLQEPPRADAWAPAGTAAHRACYLPPYLKIRARRIVA